VDSGDPRGDTASPVGLALVDDAFLPTPIHAYGEPRTGHEPIEIDVSRTPNVAPFVPEHRKEPGDSSVKTFFPRDHPLAVLGSLSQSLSNPISSLRENDANRFHPSSSDRLDSSSGPSSLPACRRRERLLGHRASELEANRRVPLRAVPA